MMVAPDRNERRQTFEPGIIAGRVPPHDLDAEAAVLSAILLSRSALDRVQEILKPDHFYSDANGRIYDAMQQLTLTGTPIDIVSVASYLRDRERLAQIGGPAYLAQLADATPAVAHVDTHAEIVFQKWRVRALIATCQRIFAEGYGDIGAPQDFIDAAERDIYALARTAQRTTVQPINAVLKSCFQEITDAAERGDRLIGMATGYEKLDGKTAGLARGDLSIVAARPGMGKTSWVMNVAANMAAPIEEEVRLPDGQREKVLKHGHGVVVFSLEMPRNQLGRRMVASEGRVSFNKVKTGTLQPDDWSRLTEAASFLSSVPVWIDDKPGTNLLEIRAKVRRVQADYDRAATPADPTRNVAALPARRVGVVIIDYLQLMRGVGRFQSREQEIAEISRGLKELAKELDVHVIALAQLNREVEKRGKNKKPQLSDLRDSGSIEQDADNVFFIHRDEYYNKETTDQRGIAEIIIAKQRNGESGCKVLLRFSDSCMRFDNLAPGDYPEMETE